MVSSHLQQLGKSPHDLSKVRSPPQWPPQLALIAGVFLGQASPYNEICQNSSTLTAEHQLSPKPKPSKATKSPQQGFLPGVTVQCGSRGAQLGVPDLRSPRAYPHRRGGGAAQPRTELQVERQEKAIIPPPFLKARYGNLQTLPSPTA